MEKTHSAKKAGVFSLSGNVFETWLFAALLSLFVLLILLLFFQPFYEKTDDMVIATLVNYARYTSDPHLVYQNYLLGLLYRFLYSLTAQIAWYAYFQYFLIFLSLSFTAWVLENRLGPAMGTVSALILEFFFGYHTYIKMQYTRTAGIAAASAILLVLFSRTSAREKQKKSALAAGILLALASFCLRYLQFIPCAGLLAGAGLYELLMILFPCRKQNSSSRSGDPAFNDPASNDPVPGVPGSMHSAASKCRAALHLVLPFLLIGAVCVLLQAYDRAQYRKDPVWSYYLRFNNARSEIYDFGFPDRKKYAAEYEALGVDDISWTLLQQWNFADTERFDAQFMENVAALKGKKNISFSLAKKFLKQIPRKLLKQHGFLLFLFSFCALLLSQLPSGEEDPAGSGKLRLYRLLGAVLSMALFGCLYFLLFYQGRVLKERVDIGLWYAVTLNMLWMAKPRGIKLSLLPCTVLSVLLLALVSKPIRLNLRSNQEAAKKQMLSARALMEEIAADPEHLYVCKQGIYSPSDAYGPFDPMPKRIYANSLLLSGWGALTGPWTAAMEAWGITNPYRDLIDHDTIYLVDKNIDQTMNYLETHYQTGLTAEYIRPAGKGAVYQIRTAAENSDS